MKVGKLVGGLLLIGLVWVLFFFGLGFSAFTPILIFFGILLIVTSYERKPSTTSETQPIREVIREKEIIREIVKIPC